MRLSTEHSFSEGYQVGDKVAITFDGQDLTGTIIAFDLDDDTWDANFVMFVSDTMYDSPPMTSEHCQELEDRTLMLPHYGKCWEWCSIDELTLIESITKERTIDELIYKLNEDVK